MTAEIRVDRITSRTGINTLSFSDNGFSFISNTGIGTTNPTSKLTVLGNVDVTGVVTATTFVGALTGTASNVTTNANLTGDVTSTGNATAIAAGVIVDADINASAAIALSKLGTTGSINTSGIITATSFSGSGSGLTGIVNSGITTVAAGTTALPSISPTGDSNTGIFFPSADTIAFAEGGAEAARFDSSGRFGIGTGLPSGPIHVTASSNGFISHTFSNTSNGSSAVNRIQIGNDASDGVGQIVVYGSQHTTLANTLDVTNAANAPIRLLTNNTERVCITGAGLVGIGTTSADQLLVVSQNAASYNPAIKISNPNTGRWGGKLIFESANGASVYDAAVIKADGGGGFGSGVLIVETAGSERCRVDGSGRLLLGTSTARTIFENGAASARVQVEGTDNSTSRLTVIRNGGGGGITLAGTAGASVGSIDAVANNATLGEIAFAGSDGTDFVNAANISVYVDGTPGANDMPGRIVLATTADGASSPTERMRIDSSGRVRIGTTTFGASEKLVVHGENNSIYVPFARSDTEWISLHSGTSDPAIFTNDGANIRFGHGTNRNGFATERMRLDSSGRLLIGTSSSSEVNTAVFQGNSAAGSAANVTISSNISNPTSTQTLAVLSFSDNSHVKAAQIECLRDGGTWTSGTSQPSALRFFTTADGASSLTERMRIDSNGNFGIGLAGGFSGTSNVYFPGAFSTTTANAANVNVAATTGLLARSTSSIVYKTQVEDLETTKADAILSLRPVWYRSLCEGDRKDWSWYGLIAEEVANIEPRLVFWRNTELVENEEGEQIIQDLDQPVPEGVMYDRVTVLLLDVVKRQQQTIEALEARLTAAGI